MDAQHELGRAKWLLFTLAVFVISSCVTWGEMTYLIFGKTTNAEVGSIYEVTRRSRFGVTKSKQLSIEYSFTESDGTRRKADDTVSIDWEFPIDGKLKVQYTAGANGKSRIAGNVNWVGLLVFGVSLLAFAFFAYRMWKEANETPEDRRKARRSKSA